MQATRLFTILLTSFFVSATANSLKAQTITHVPLYTFYGNSEYDYFGSSVSGAGDINGDGMADLIVGARNEDSNGSNSGSVRVFSGSDGSVLYNFDGDNQWDQFGHSVSGAGDVNGDGTPDLIVGSPFPIFGGNARVLSGSDGSVLHNFYGSAGDQFGYSVSGAGDVDGDGTPDLIVGARFDEEYGIDKGSACVFSGSDGSVLYNFYGDRSGDQFGFSVSGAGDVNGDGTPDLIVGAADSARVLSGSDGSVLYNFDVGGSVSGAGDVNQDGFDDLIVGASGNARVLSGSDGRVLYIYRGGARSVNCAGDVNGDGSPDLIVSGDGGNARVFSGSNGSVLHDFVGDSAGDDFGYSVSGAGDVNGDGIDDFIVGNRHGKANGGYARVFVSQVLGDCNQDGVVNFLDVAPFISILSAGDFLGQADINQDEIVDFLDIAPFIALLSS